MLNKINKYITDFFSIRIAPRIFNVMRKKKIQAKENNDDNLGGPVWGSREYQDGVSSLSATSIQPSRDFLAVFLSP